MLSQHDVADAFVVRVDQRNLDVVVSLQEASGRQAVAVDSPTKRASAEVLLAGPRLSGKYALLVQAKPGIASAQRASLTLEHVDGPTALLAGLAEMTRAAAPDERQTPESGKDRIAQLQAALATLQSAGAKRMASRSVVAHRGDVLLGRQRRRCRSIERAPRDGRVRADWRRDRPCAGRDNSCRICHRNCDCREGARAAGAPTSRSRRWARRWACSTRRRSSCNRPGSAMPRHRRSTSLALVSSIRAITARHARATSRPRRFFDRSATRRAQHFPCRTLRTSTTTAAIMRRRSRASSRRSTSSIRLRMPGSTSRY